MGHYMEELAKPGNEERFPTLDTSVIPLVWAREGIGKVVTVIKYSRNDDIVHLRDRAYYGTLYEKSIAESILTLLADKEEVLILMELSTGSCGTYIERIQSILPRKATFINPNYVVEW